MAQIIDKTHYRTDVFEVVNKWPLGGYKVWSIGRHNFQHEGYIPLAQDGEEMYHVRLKTLKALYVGDEQLCLRILKEASYHEVDEDKFNEIVKDYGSLEV